MREAHAVKPKHVKEQLDGGEYGVSVLHETDLKSLKKFTRYNTLDTRTQQRFAFLFLQFVLVNTWFEVAVSLLTLVVLQMAYYPEGGT